MAITIVGESLSVGGAVMAFLIEKSLGLGSNPGSAAFRPWVVVQIKLS